MNKCRPESAMSYSNTYGDLQAKSTSGTSMHGRGLTSLLGTGISSQTRRMATTIGTEEGEDFSPQYPPHNHHQFNITQTS